MGKKSFEAGMAAGVKPVGEKLDQLGQKIENVRSKQEEVKEKLSMLSDDLEIKDKLRQLGLEDYHDLTELDESEKVILMSLLYWLAEHKTPSDSQRKYLSCLGRYIGVLGIKENISPVDVLQNISDTDVHKVFLRTILEYVYLDTQTWTFDESEQDLIGTFEVGPRTLENIKRGIEGEFHILGDDGLAQKYDIREVLKESEQVQSAPTKETEVKEAVNSDMGIADGEEPGRPFHQLVSTIQRYTMTEKLGKPLLITMAETEKNRLIAKVLPTIPLVSKTVVEITKLKSGHLVFTTSAMYWATNKDVKKISYSELNPGCLGIRPTETGTAFVYTFKANDPLEIMDSRLSADFLERLLLEINRVGEYAGTDALTNFPNLPQEVQLSYMRFVANVVRESGHSLHEVYRLAVLYGLNEHWDYIGTEFELPFEDEFRTYSEKIPYPNEEALAISMLKDICTVYQYTKDSDILVAPEKKYFLLIFNDSTTKRDQIIRYAQLEKRTMESRVDPKEVQKITDDFSNTVFGGIGGCIGMMGAMFPMPFVPGTASPIAATAVSSIVFSNKNKKLFSEIEMRQKVQNEVIQSYQRAEKAANDQGFPEFFNLLQQEEIRIASRIGIQRTGYTEKEKAVLDQIRTLIVVAFTAFQNVLIEDGHEDLIKWQKLAKDLTLEEQEKLVSGLAISSHDAKCTDIIAFSNRAYLDDTISENFEGMLFLSDCIYFRNKKSVYAQRMPYFNMQKIEKKWTSIMLYERNGDVIKLDKSTIWFSLLQDIINIVNQSI